MTDRITRRKTPMLEYGRKPYLVTKETVPEGENADYRYMMDTTWHKAQDNKYIVVQSVMKKPYRQQDYQMMENEGDGYTVMYPKYDFPLPVLEPVNTGSESYSGLKWIQCATPVSASKIYTIIVQNSSKTASTIVNGRTRKSKTIYSPTTFQLAKYTPSAKGFSLSNIINKGATTWVTLTTSSDAEGTYSIHATDGRNVIKKKVTKVGGDYFGLMLSTEDRPPYYWAVYDKELNFLNVYPYGSLTAITPNNETRFIWYRDIVGSDYVTRIKKDGADYNGPHTIDTDFEDGSYISATLPRWLDGVFTQTENGASLGTNWIFGYQIITMTPPDTYEYNNYLDINGTPTLISTYNNAGGWNPNIKSWVYNSYLTNMYMFSTGSVIDDYAKLVLRIMDSTGTIITKDLSSISFFSEDLNQSITLNGIDYSVDPYFKKVTFS